MKTIILGLTILGFMSPVLAMDQAELDNRVSLLTEKFEVMQQKPDKRIPADILSKAKGIVLLDRTKAGFIFAYQGGGGVAMARSDGGQWSPAAFLSANEASLGFQVGGEQNFFVMLFMDSNSVQEVITQTGELGGDARGTAGNDAAGVGGNVTSPKQYNVLVYSDRNGLYGGAFVKAGVISPDDKANVIYYGQSLTMKDILLDKKVKATPTATDLAEKISAYSRQQ
jgi:lipid-binding SYLF domain-containing protein